MAPDGGLDRFLSWRQVRDLTGLGRTTAWRLRRTGDFPDPVPISPGRVAWRQRDIAAWNESRGAVIPIRPAVSRPLASMKAPLAESRALDAHAIISEAPPTKLRSARRARTAVAQGQLGFDF